MRNTHFALRTPHLTFPPPVRISGFTIARQVWANTSAVSRLLTSTAAAPPGGAAWAGDPDNVAQGDIRPVAVAQDR